MKNKCLLYFLLLTLFACSNANLVSDFRKPANLSNPDIGQYFFLEFRQKQIGRITDIDNKGRVTFEVLNESPSVEEFARFKSGEVYTFPGEHFRSFENRILFADKKPLAPLQFYMENQKVLIAPKLMEVDEVVNTKTAKLGWVNEPVAGKYGVDTVGIGGIGDHPDYTEMERIHSLVPEKRGVVIGEEFSYMNRTLKVEAIMDNGSMDVRNSDGQRVKKEFTVYDFEIENGKLQLKVDKPKGCAKALTNFFKLL